MKKNIFFCNLIEPNGIQIDPPKENKIKRTWEKLEKLYMRKCWSNKLTLKAQLYGLTMVKGGHVMAHLNDLTGVLATKYNEREAQGEEPFVKESSERGRTKEKSKPEKNSRSKI
ncbi:hypothetical protein ACOSP7_004898 [Xanthoceras sorbifolium]